MNDFEKKKINELREQGLGYKKIAQILEIKENTVKSFFRRNKGLKQTDDVCIECGKPLKQIKGKKARKFCSDKCRMKWWNCHKDLVNKKTVREFICPGCGRRFSVYGNIKRKYCSHDCYIRDRFGGHRNE
ncbi:MAG: RNA polymerase subunit sigma-70 [Butyrivibrio sp.]|nr:RNA polymerase subunit sigma-70 [Butyrivibrio sp.]